RGQYERPLLALTVLVTLVLLITCTNVGNLLVVRNTARRRELTMRVALGASRSRLILQCLVESVVLAAMGGLRALGRVDHVVDAAAAGNSRRPGVPGRRSRARLRRGRVAAGRAAVRTGPGVACDPGRSDGRAPVEPGQHADEEYAAPGPAAGGLPGGVVGGPAGRRRIVRANAAEPRE